MGIFGKTQETTPKDMVQEWTRKLRKESRQLDRQIRSIQREESKIKKSLKDAAKNKNTDREACLILAKEIVHSRKATTRIYTSKAHINSVVLQMNNQLATLRIAGSISKSTEVMQAMQRLIRVPEIAQTMHQMSKEMMKAGIIEDILNETFESLEEDSEELEESAQKEVDNVLWEITEGKLGEAPAPPLDGGDLAAASSSGQQQQIASNAESDEEDIEEMQTRLAALKS